MSDRVPSPGELTPDMTRQVQSTIGRFRRAWQEGLQPDLAEYVSATPELRPYLLRVLVRIDLEFRRQAGERIDEAAYRQRFPDLPAETDPNEQTATYQNRSTSQSIPIQITSSTISRKFGRYEIVRELGHGAMGAVYLARDTQLGRQVALKAPRFEASGNADLLERFYREARAAGGVRHPHVCPVHDVGQIDGQHYITMAFIEGRTLKELIHSKKPPTERQAAIVIRKIALGLAEAHAQGVVHRDLKPANVMIDKGGEPIVMDFGLAHCTEDAHVTHSGQILGTPAYMSPEQTSGDQTQVGAAADIYCLGVILYELLTGRQPFEGTVMAILKQIAYDMPRRPTALKPAIDPRLEAICLKMMSKRPADRFASMKEVSRVLAEYLKAPASGPLSSPSTTLPQQPTAASAISASNPASATSVLPASSPGDALSILESLRVTSRSATQGKVGRSTSLLSHLVDRSKTRGWTWLVVGSGLLAMLIVIAVALFGPPNRKTKVVGKSGNPAEPPIRVSASPESSPDVKASGNLDREVAERFFAAERPGDNGPRPQVSVRLTRTGESMVATKLEELPREAFQVVSIYSSSSDATDGDFARFAELKELRTLGIWSGHLTDAIADSLVKMPQLTTLNLSAPISDLTLAKIATLTSLESLSIHSGSKITDRGFVHLGSLRSLQRMHLAYLEITDEAFAPLADLPIHDLYLQRCPIAGTGLAALKQLRQMTLNDVTLSESGMSTIASLPNLEGLILSGTNGVSRDCLELGKSKSLRSLSLNGAVLKNADLVTFRDLDLHNISLFRSNITDNGLAEIGRWDNLESITLSECSITDTGLMQLAPLTKLRTIDLTKTGVTAKGASALRKLLPECSVVGIADLDRELAAWALALLRPDGAPVTVTLRMPRTGEQAFVTSGMKLPDEPFEVTELELSNVKELTGDDLTRLQQLNSLGSLSIHCPHVTDATVEILTRFSTVHTLVIQGPLSDRQLQKLPAMTSLRKLSLFDANVTGEGFKGLAAWRKLDQLGIYNTPISDSDLAALSSLPFLNSLTLSQCSRVDGTGLANLKQLRQLWLMGLNLEDAGMQAIAALPKLESFSLSGTKPNLIWIGKIASLKMLYLTACEINPDELVHLDKLDLTYLSLQQSNVTDAMLPSILRFKNLEVLILYSTQITDQGLPQLASLPRLRTLNVANTAVTEKGVAALRKLLPECNVYWPPP